MDTGDATRCNNDHVLSPDGVHVGLSSAGPEGHSLVYVASLSGGGARQVTPIGPSYLHGWSPDGETLAYCAERHGEFDIYTIPAAGGEETRLTDAPGLNDGPEYSPDGKHIWFNSVRSGLMQVWRMNADGSQQTRITQDEESNCWFPHLSPDGKQVAYIAYKKGDVAPRGSSPLQGRGDPPDGPRRSEQPGAGVPLRRPGHPEREQLVPRRNAPGLRQLPACGALSGCSGPAPPAGGGNWVVPTPWSRLPARVLRPGGARPGPTVVAT